MLIIIGMFTFGVLGFWGLFIVFIILLISAFFKKVYGISFLIASIILMLTASYLFNNEIIKFDFDIVKYVKSYPVWINMITGIAYISAMLIFPISLQRKFFISTIDELIIAKEKAEKSDELQKAKDKIEESEKKFKLLFNKSNDAILLLDNQKFVDCNDATVKLLAYETKDEVLNTHPSELSPELQPDGRFSYEKANEMIEIALKTGSNRFEWLHQKKNKENFYVDVRLTAIPLMGKTIIYTVWRDITEKKKAESELKLKNEELTILNQAFQTQNKELLIAKEKAEESDKLKSSFLANMSHEIRTPLNGILGFASLLENRDLSAEKREKFVQIINNSGNHLLNIINDIIDISKIDANQLNLLPEKFSLNIFLYEIIGFFKSILEGKNKNNITINLIKAFKDESDIIYTDKTRLKQILNNLIGNAIKFTNNGFINIEYKLINNKELLFTVTDSGIGISQHELEIIFQRFRQADESNTRKYGGTGLGLAISEACVKLLGGEISVKSELGKGTSFSFTIPYITKESAKFII
ncbi:MAG: PAS domain S-box protein [Bacteroidales bacterium]|nr:PAS domain S-box protein [Bacteroidales bacterium]MBN2755707.1 PAS domain S-box protein [Bacteroidales bacterium]